MQISSKAEGFFVLGGLRKKYITRCQTLRSKTVCMHFNKKCIQKYSEGLVQIN